MGIIAKQIKLLRKLCSHPIIAGAGHDEFPGGYGRVTWKCSECESPIKEDTVLEKGTLICFWSNAILKRTCKFSEMRDSDQKRINSAETKRRITMIEKEEETNGTTRRS